MSLDLDDAQIEQLASDVQKSGNPVRGELIFRKPELTCLSCHAIGGAGGLTGPDLSSLGTSSPAETIIKSIVYPTESIKEGYEMQRVARKDGSEEIGKASCRERVCKYVVFSVVAVSLKKKKIE